MTDPNVAIVFNGFLALSMKEKMRLVEVMNDFFDNTDRREGVRKVNEGQVARLLETDAELICKCCRR